MQIEQPAGRQDTATLETFGEFIWKRRQDLGISLRSLSASIGSDPSNWSRVERGVTVPPRFRRLGPIAKALKIGAGSADWIHMVDLAAAGRVKPPPDLGPEYVRRMLPLFFADIRSRSLATNPGDI